MDEKSLKELKSLICEAENLVKSKRRADSLISTLNKKQLRISSSSDGGLNVTILNDHFVGGKLQEGYQQAVDKFRANLIQILEEEKQRIDINYEALGKKTTFRVKDSTDSPVEGRFIHIGPPPADAGCPPRNIPVVAMKMANLLKSDEEVGIGDVIPEIKKK